MFNLRKTDRFLVIFGHFRQSALIWPGIAISVRCTAVDRSHASEVGEKRETARLARIK